SNWHLFQADAHWPFFERLRKEDPVHFHADSRYGPYWSITRFDHIKAIDTDHHRFSSQDNITIVDQSDEFQFSNFIAMDPPRHDEQRKVVTPVVGPRNLAEMEGLIRSRVNVILEDLPLGEPFNWVDRVSIELTTQMLATLFDFPFEDRRLLTRWSDINTLGPKSGLVDSWDEARAELMECLAYFSELFEQRKRAGHEGFDLLTLLARDPKTRDMPPMEFLGNLILLIVGGNDTTRNSISGGVLALNQFPEQYHKLRQNPALIPNMVAEIIRWQTPLAHMRRTAMEDVEFQGKTIRKGDKVVMWYVSGNRDDAVFDDPNRLIIDRANARQHVSFGYGIHRCMGNRLAEMQLRVLWEEIQKRFHQVEVVGEPVRTLSNFVKGYSSLPVVVHPL
ncbi:MAG: cytochrome P450, partial [Proteobacteria bacterium]|nr:cytochrome P450 [Pseudomonadota bacterium]